MIIWSFEPDHITLPHFVVKSISIVVVEIQFFSLSCDLTNPRDYMVI